MRRPVDLVSLVPPAHNIGSSGRGLVPLPAQAWIAVTLLAVMLTSCASEPERSREAFCQTYVEQEQALIDKYAERAAELDASDDPFAALFGATASLYESQVDMAIMMDHLSKVAPTDIQPDVEFLRDALNETSASAETDLLQALVNGFVASARTNGPAERIDAYIQTNC